MEQQCFDFEDFDWYEFYEAGDYEFDGYESVECPEGYYLYDETDECWYVLDEATGFAYELEVFE